VLQVVDPHQREPGTFTRFLPRRIQHARYRLTTVGEYVRGMLTTPGVDDGHSNAIENDQSLVAVLDPRAGNDEDRGPQARES